MARICGYSEMIRRALPYAPQPLSEANPESTHFTLYSCYFHHGLEADPLFVALPLFRVLFIHKKRFNYLTPRVKITPADLRGTKKEKPKTLHFICTPELATEVAAEINADSSWKPLVVYEPIPVSIISFTSEVLKLGLIID